MSNLDVVVTPVVVGVVPGAILVVELAIALLESQRPGESRGGRERANFDLARPVERGAEPHRRLPFFFVLAYETTLGLHQQSFESTCSRCIIPPGANGRWAWRRLRRT